MIICQICNENEGDIWCHSDGGIGTPICYGLNLHVCELCDKTRKDEVETVQRRKMKENRKAATESLKKKIWSNEPDTSGMKHYAFQYWFQKLEWNDLKQYEEWLGFELSPHFKHWIENLECCECGKHIHKPTDEESEQMAKGLPELGPRPEAFLEEEKENRLWFKENGEWAKEGAKEWRKRYENYHKEELNEWEDKYQLWRKRFKILQTAKKHLIKSPQFPEDLRTTPFDQLRGIPEYDEYSKLYRKHRESEIQYHFCSEKCIKKALSEDKDLVWTHY